MFCTTRLRMASFQDILRGSNFLWTAQGELLNHSCYANTLRCVVFSWEIAGSQTLREHTGALGELLNQRARGELPIRPT